MKEKTLFITYAIASIAISGLKQLTLYATEKLNTTTSIVLFFLEACASCLVIYYIYRLREKLKLKGKNILLKSIRSLILAFAITISLTTGAFIVYLIYISNFEKWKNLLSITSFAVFLYVSIIIITSFYLEFKKQPQQNN